MDIAKDRRSVEVIVAEDRRRKLWNIRVKVLIFFLSILGFTALWIWAIRGDHFNEYSYDAWAVAVPISTLLWWFGCSTLYNENEDWPMPNVVSFPSPLFVFGPISLLVLIIRHWKEVY